jgi:hypothetical protein
MLWSATPSQLYQTKAVVAGSRLEPIKNGSLHRCDVHRLRCWVSQQAHSEFSKADHTYVFIFIQIRTALDCLNAFGSAIAFSKGDERLRG